MEEVKKIKKGRTKKNVFFSAAQSLKTEPATGRKHQKAGKEKFNLSIVISFLFSRF